jgi:hypothetical protein
MTNEVDQFIQLLADTKVAYDKSDAKALKESWAYSVTATRFTPQTPLIVGFNWGAGGDEKYSPQDAYPIYKFGDIPSLGSFARTIDYFKKYCPEALQGMMSNYCFFRSKAENQISAGDLELCKELFTKMLAIAKPSRIITFSGALKRHLIHSKMLTDFQEKTIPNGRSSVIPMKGMLVMGGRNVAVCYLPHPNSPVTGDAREACWEFVFR